MGLLADKICLVSGAGQGLGRSIAREMAKEGAVAILLERNPQTLKAVAQEIEAEGGRAEAHALDVTDYERYAEIVADVVARHGRIDVLVNNAAINPPTRTILNDTLEEWRRTITINLEAVYMGSKLVAPHMVRQQDGRIIHIASIQGFASSGDCGAYNAAKGGIIAYTKSMAVELGRYNILVNSVAPGFMVTPMSVVNGVDETTTPDYIEWYITRRKIPLGRSGQPEDVSGTVVFLASDYCRYMTGQLLVVDGGLMSTF
ncbi:SDR family oxidoreductase [Nordella sp. HKS 07]|uniref:SDR family NAD(P)-dependent oxidoreductase n=1 Tax=Nordella sp. HKS 07 TaxID=2712222 RepID=UPI0013E1EEA7|nr:SDR family NAD(P)-dependent oxidoreductase [Nordella sp. HKS 07]QIG47791.1 SDR family oxidoreductase [Nordella sp. HKS 07]